MNTQTCHAAIRINVEAQVCIAERIVDREAILCSAAQAGGSQQFRPLLLVRTRLERTFFRKIAGEVRGVHDDAAHNAGRAEPDLAPVVVRRAMAARFPSIHPLARVGVLVRNKDRRRGFEEILLGPEEFVGGPEHFAAEPLRGKIHQFCEIGHRLSTRPLERRKSAPLESPSS